MSSAPPGQLADHLLLFNLAMDEADPILGFAIEWVNALASQSRRVSVITMRAGRFRVRENVTVQSVGGESGVPKAQRVARFYRLLARMISTQRADVCFSHMMPKFSALGGPLLKAAGIPLVTWYTHPKCTMWLRAAHFMSDRVVTAFANTYPYKRDKLRVIGHAVDTGLFSLAPSGPLQPRILYVGRLSPVKNVDVLLEAFARVLKKRNLSETQLRIIGHAPTRDRGYSEHLRNCARDLGIADSVEWIPGVPHAKLGDEYRSATVHVNLAASGFGDKVALESMSCGVPSIVATRDFEQVLGDERGLLLTPPRDVDTLTDRMATILTMSPNDRAHIGRALRRSVEHGHSLSTLPRRIAEVVHEVHSSPQSAGHPVS